MRNTDFVQIIREKEFDNSCERIAQNYARLAELDDAIDWALSRIEQVFIENPNEFQFISDDFYLWVTDNNWFLSNLFPQVRILFKYISDTEIVILISIEEI